jgi:hypothetical protein
MAKVELVHKRRVVNQTRARRKILNKTEKDPARVGRCVHALPQESRSTSPARVRAAHLTCKSHCMRVSFAIAASPARVRAHLTCNEFRTNFARALELRGIGSCRLQGHVRECQSAFVTTSCKGMIRRIFDELVFVAWRRSSRERLSKRFAVNSNSHGTWRSPCLLIYSACAGDHGQVQRCRVRSQSDRLCQA